MALEYKSQHVLDEKNTTYITVRRFITSGSLHYYSKNVITVLSHCNGAALMLLKTFFLPHDKLKSALKGIIAAFCSANFVSDEKNSTFS